MTNAYVVERTIVRRKVMLALAAVVILLLVVAIATPNLLKSRIAANKASFINRSRLSPENEGKDEFIGKAQLGIAAPSNRKMIYNAELALVVKNLHQAASNVR